MAKLEAVVQILRADRQEYQKAGEKRVAHRVTVITPEGHAGALFLGGNTERAADLYRAAVSLAGQSARLVFGFSSFRGDLRVDLVGIEPSK